MWQRQEGSKRCWKMTMTDVWRKFATNLQLKKNNAVSVKCNRVRQPYTRAVATVSDLCVLKKRALGTPGGSSGYQFSLPRAHIQPRIHSSVHSLRHFATPWTAAHQASLSITNPGAYSNSCPSGWWCHPTISSSVSPFSSCLQSFPASGSFPRSQLFTLGDQSIGASASASVLPMNTQDWSPLGWTGWISWQSKELSRVLLAVQGTLKSLLQHHSLKTSILWHSAFLMVQFTSIHDYWKNHSFD